MFLRSARGSKKRFFRTQWRSIGKDLHAKQTQGQALHQAMALEKPLQIPGVIHAFAAKLAESCGFRALYLSGAGLANASFALPDLGLTGLNDVVDAVSKITTASPLPLLVDVDTGWGSPLNVRRAFKLISRAKAAGAHIEDQVESKRCGHRGGKHLVPVTHMVGKLKAALDGREDDSFMVIARTDAIAVEGIDCAIERALAYQAAGADAIFAEAVTSLDDYQRFTQSLSIPVLANMTEFGKSPLYTVKQLAQVGISLVIYPVSAFRAMNQTALQVYAALRKEGTQQSVVEMMQSREELYRYLGYEKFEQEQNQYLASMENNHGSDQKKGPSMVAAPRSNSHVNV